MAAQVEMEGLVGARLHLSPLTDSSNKTLMEDSPIITPEPKKPAPGPKPRLTPKPFSMDRNTIRPIIAPKPQPKPKPESLPKPEPPSKPKPASLKPGVSSVNEPVKPKPSEPATVVRRTSMGPSVVSSSPRTSSITRAKSMGGLSSMGMEEDGTGEGVLHTQETRSSRPRPASAIYSPASATSPAPAPRWAERRSLIGDLTSKFEAQGGSSVLRRPPAGESKENTPEEDDAGVKDDERNDAKPLEKAGSGIKRRISLLIDSSVLSLPPSRGAEPRSPVTETDCAIGVKQRIKELTEEHSAASTSLQRPQVKPRPLALDLTKR